MLWQSLSDVAPPPCSPFKPALGGAGGDGRVTGQLRMLRGHQQQGCPQTVPSTGATTSLPSLPTTGWADGRRKAGDFSTLAAQFLPARSWFLIPSPCCSDPPVLLAAVGHLWGGGGSQGGCSRAGPSLLHPLPASPAPFPWHPPGPGEPTSTDRGLRPGVGRWCGPHD